MLLICIVCLILSGAHADIDLVIPIDQISLPQGNIIGDISLYGNYRKFVGIPYATVVERFQAPGDPPTWNDTLTANNDIPPCPQYNSLMSSPVIGSEQCLGLDIYTPLVPQDEALPVMVFIHGGGWFSGSNNQYIYDPRYLVQKKVIVVTINYRLGALGFLCLGNKGAPGNAGLKDQVAALKWVKNNIKYFGGNPDSVTLFGQDAGSASVNYLLMSPLSNGLFHREIMQSGPALVPMAFDSQPIKTASSIAAELGFDSTDPDELLEFFKQVPIPDLITVSYKDPTNNAFAPYIFRPCVEALEAGALITASPVNMIKSASLNSDLKVIIGYDNKDLILLASKYNVTGYRNILKDFTQIIPDNLSFPNENDKENFIKDVKRIYFENGNGNAEFYDSLVNYFSESLIMYPSVATTEYLLKNHNVSSVYNYYFTYESFRNLAKLSDGNPEESGADHGDELFYLFEPGPFQLLPVSKEDAKMIYKMTTMWARFAVTGNPSIPTELPWAIKWKESTSDNLNFMKIDKDLEIIPLPNKERIDFWKNTYEKYGIWQ